MVQLTETNQSLADLNKELADLGSFGFFSTRTFTATRRKPCDYLHQEIGAGYRNPNGGTGQENETAAPKPGKKARPYVNNALAIEIIKSCEYDDLVTLTRSNLTRVGVVGFIIFFIALLVGLCRYNSRLAAFHDARADALSLGRPDLVSFDTLVDKMSPDAVSYGKQPVSPIDQVASLAGKIRARS
jgi:hypothetical protein